MKREEFLKQLEQLLDGISEEEKAHKLLNKLILDGVNVDKFEIKKPTLNDIFIEKVGE